jgi:anti-anti-sigma regulatory factor
MPTAPMLTVALGQVTFLGAAGLGVIVQTRNELAQHGRE